MRLILKYTYRCDPSYETLMVVPLIYKNKEQAIIDLKSSFLSCLKNNYQLLKRLYFIEQDILKKIGFSKDLTQHFEESDKIKKIIMSECFLKNEKLTLYSFLSEFFITDVINDYPMNDDKAISILSDLYPEPIILTLNEFYAD